MEPDENDPIDEPSDYDELDYYGNHPDDANDTPSFSLKPEEAFIFPTIDVDTI